MDPNERQLVEQRLRDRAQIREDVRELFSSERGQRVLRFLMREAYITRPVLTTDPQALLVKEGKQQIVLSLLHMVLQEEDLVAASIIQNTQQEIDTR